MSEKYTVERVIKIYDDTTGCHIYVGPDADGLDGVEIRSVDGERIEARVFIGTPEQAVLTAQAILELYGPKQDQQPSSTEST